MKGCDSIIYFIVVILSALLILALWKWVKWKITSFIFTMFVIEKYRKPTEEELRYYARILAKKVLHIK